MRPESANLGCPGAVAGLAPSLLQLIVPSPAANQAALQHTPLQRCCTHAREQQHRQACTLKQHTGLFRHTHLRSLTCAQTHTHTVGHSQDNMLTHILYVTYTLTRTSTRAHTHTTCAHTCACTCIHKHSLSYTQNHTHARRALCGRVR